MKGPGRIMKFRENFHGSLCGKSCWAVVVPWITKEEAEECAKEIGMLSGVLSEVVRIRKE